MFMACLGVQAQENEAAWENTVQTVIPSVVTLRVSKVRSFDTEASALLDGTGFVVDAERGIILTNRHIVSTGPVRAEAVFSNQEEVDVQRIYADPVHDFGFLRYDPGDLLEARPSGLPLAPEAAEVGRAIRVVGNDAGNRISVLDGTIARLDQKAPRYGGAGYNDFNTFYLQASSGTSGGSSGSPVIDLEGRAIALNAGAQRQAATSYFLPLERVRRALDLIRRGEPVPRGGLLATFEELPFAELRRMGLTDSSERGARDADAQRSGLLVLRSMVKGSQAAEHLRPGDILIRIDGAAFPDFVQLEAVLDNNVGRPVELAIERQGRVVELSIGVTDLHAVTPDEYISIGSAILHPVSYQQARNFNVPLNGIYVAHRGYMLARAGIETGSILYEIYGQPLNGLDAVETALAGLRHGEVVQYRYINPRAGAINTALRSGRMVRRWHPAERCRHAAESHEWTCRALEPPATPEAVERRNAPARKFDDKRLERIAPSLVHVEFDMPFPASGIPGGRYSGAGVIVDSARGWVVVDRNTAPESVGDAVLTFNGTLEVPAEVAYVHPAHSLAILRYDPQSLHRTPVREAELASELPAPGEEIFLAGFRRDQDLFIRTYEAGSRRFIGGASAPSAAFRESNLEVMEVDDVEPGLTGVVVDSGGRVSALWSSFLAGTGSQVSLSGGMNGTAPVLRRFRAGLPIEHVRTMMDHLRRGTSWRSLEVSWERVPLSMALQRGLPETWRSRFEEHDPGQLQMLAVGRAVAGSPAAGELLPGDLLLSINGAVATQPRDVEQAIADRPEAEVTVWRNGQETTREFATVELGWDGLREILFWAGATLQNPQRAIAEQLGIEPQGVSVQQFYVASPAHRSLYPAGCFQITRLNGSATPDLEAFTAALSGIRVADSVRVEGISQKGVPVFATVKLDPVHWPTDTLRYGPNGWERKRLFE